MPHVIQSANGDRKQRPGRKRSDFICQVKYSNTLPDTPFEPKSIKYPFGPNRFVEYKPTTLEKNFKYDLLTERDLGLNIDLINPATYAIDPSVSLHPDDERLLEDDGLTTRDSKRSRQHNKTVPWLKKTEYISTEFNRYGNSSEKTETKVGYNVKKLLKEEYVYMNKESQIAAINKTFTDAKVPIEKHYSKPNVFAVEELPVFPDFKLWRYQFAQVIFDTEPAAKSQMKEMSEAMISAVMDESGEKFVAYFLPTEETVRKRKRDSENCVEYEDDEEYEYKKAREYNLNLKNKDSNGYVENYFMVFRDGRVYYNELETRVRLRNRRMKPVAQLSNSKLIVKHRPFNEAEIETHELRMMKLNTPKEEEVETQEYEEKEKEYIIEENDNDDEKGEHETTEDDKASSSSPSSSESEAEDTAQNKKDVEEIFGSDSV